MGHDGYDLSEPAVYAFAPTNGSECTRSRPAAYESLLDADGFRLRVCVAARATDKLGNVGASLLLALLHPVAVSE